MAFDNQPEVITSFTASQQTAFQSFLSRLHSHHLYGFLQEMVHPLELDSLMQSVFTDGVTIGPHVSSQQVTWNDFIIQ
jgi:hypothetical protein